MNTYRPYTEGPESEDDTPISDSEAGLDSDYTETPSGTDGSDDDGSYAPQKLFIPPDRAELYRLGGPSIKDEKQALKMNSAFESYQSGQSKPIDYGKTILKLNSQSKQTIILVDSIDRDRVAYPQPTSLQLHLPRVYKNVTSLVIQQMKLLTAFLYFRDNKFNTNFKVWEEDRYLINGASNIIDVRIREGSYNINTLLDELTIQMNTTPTFFSFPNGFTDFAVQFSINGDLGLNFNLPGDYYYDSLLEKYIKDPTFDYIITRYFLQRYIIQSYFSLDEIVNAYYYPVLKEALLDPVEYSRITLPSADSGEDAFQRIIYGFSGLNDTYTLAVINANIAELDRYRQTRTFYNSLVNKYVWSYNSWNNRINVSATTLNTSLVKLFNQQSAVLLSNALLQFGIANIAAYQTLVSNTNKQNAVVVGLYNYYQVQLANYFAVNYATYTIDQLANPFTYIYIQDGRDAEGVFTSYSSEYISAINANALLPIPNFNYVPSSPVLQWPGMVFDSNNPTMDISFGIANNLDSPWYINSNTADRLNIYDFTLSNMNPNEILYDSNAIINANLKYGSADIVANISAGQYAVFAIRSPCRQLLQVETLARPYAYRYTTYNSNFGGLIPFYFNADYEFNNYSSIDTAEGNIYTTMSSLTYGLDRDQVSSLAPFSNNYNVNISSNYAQFKITMPQPPSSLYGTDAVGFDYQIQLELSNANPGANFSTSMGVYLYHDRAAYMADAYNLRNEKALNYLTSFHFSSISSFVQPITVLASNDYYVIVRPDNTSFQTEQFKLYAYWNAATSTPRKLLSNYVIQQAGVSSFSDQYGLLYSDTPSTVNYFFYKTYNSNYVRLPIQSSLFGLNPTDQQFNFIYPNGAPVIGYDDNNISDDLTDYRGYTAGTTKFIPGNQFSQDPMNQFVFNYLSQYDASTSQSYFYSTSSNSVLQSTNLSLYTPFFSTVTQRDYKIVHWWDNNFLGPQENDAPGYSLTGVSSISTMAAYTTTTTSGTPIGGYNYTLDPDLSLNTLRIGKGIYGITFLPTQGLWDINKMSFKSAYMGSNDPNDLIEYIGIFDTNSIVSQTFENIDLRGASAVLKRTKKVVYTPSFVASNNGFDPSYGSWYEYTVLPLGSFPYARPDIVNQGLPGYTPYPCTIITLNQNLYSAVAFTASYEPTTYFMLTGSAVPFPENTTATPSNDYLGVSMVGGKQFVVPTNLVPPSGSNYIRNIYQSQYEQSLPIGTTGLNYGDDIQVYLDPDALYDYSPFGGLIGYDYFKLRTANYYEGSNHYFLFGDPTGISTNLVDIYRLRNQGGPGIRDCVYIDTIDLTSNVVPGEQIITWGANSYSLFALTRPSPGSHNVKIYEISSLTGTNSSAVYQNLNLVGVQWLGSNVSTFSNIPAFSTAVAALTITNNKDWIYADNMYVSSTGYLLPNQRGFIQFNNNNAATNSTFTSLTYDLPGTATRFQYFDITAHTAATNSYNLFYDSLVNVETVRLFDFSNSVCTVTAANGQIYNRIEAVYNTLRTEIRIGTNYAPYVSNIFTTTEGIYAISYDPSVASRFQYLELGPGSFPGESNATLLASAAEFSTSVISASNFSAVGDPQGGIWFGWQSGDQYSVKPITVEGNSHIGGDIHEGIYGTAYQIFYPTMKIVLNKEANRYNDITNLIDIDWFGSTFNEYPRTQTFFYNDWDNLMKDLTNSNGNGSTIAWKWGQESNFYRGDTEFQGYAFNSYIYNIPLSTSGAYGLTDPNRRLVGLSNGNPNDYSYVVIRGYAPTEDFQCMVRFNLPNRYDYGIVTPNNFAEEISSVQSTFALPNYNPNYVIDLYGFNAEFSTTQVYGANSLSNFAGSTITTTGYSNFFAIFSTLYDIYDSSATVLAEIQSTIVVGLNDYISTYFGNILPSSIYSHTRITDAIPYDLLFSTSVAPQVASNDINWGLGYNLGYDRLDYGGRTVYYAPSFYKILDDYIYLQLNDQLSMNLLDTTGRESLSTSQESTGEVRKYYSKLLLNTFGSYSQTMIGTQATFNPPLGKLDKLTFNWVDINGNVIDNNDCEWSAVFQINEQENVAVPDSMIPRLMSN
jgi:hypothetical protein